MARTKVTDQAITTKLVSVVKQIYNGPDRDKLTVNYARKEAEDSLGLEDGYLKEGDWKAKSKEIILNTMNELENADDESPQPSPSPKKQAKAGPRKSNNGSQKRGKKTVAPSDVESDISEASDAKDAPVRPAKKRKVTKATQKKTKVLSDDEDDSPAAREGRSDEESPKPAKKPQPKSRTDNESGSELSDAPDSLTSKPVSEKEDTAKLPEDDDSELSDVIDEQPKRKPKPKAKPAPKPEPAATSTNLAADDSSSELSSLIDEAPPPKRKRKSGKDTAAPTKRGAKPSSTAATADSPDEAQIKLLQSHLSKCGVRKVWGAEFKRHGADTPKAKIRHLKGMLADVGMPGRFSEAKAREIKEMRELQADLQDVMQGEKSWGVESGGRGARRRAAAGGGAAAKGSGKRVREVTLEGSDEEGGGESGEEKSEEGSEDEDAKHAVRGKGLAKRRADLAFLGDESESE
ncbi:hypothetical protein B0I37DRAFT_354417 [Chaetomium sp. MPI-CAGE-AT-0009]|nr:hypothetical protein B0I37DRAFT_354417 [Chaetomium sp. MPI-CAGE-AT-0009]